jgi:hypothetical protein
MAEDYAQTLSGPDLKAGVKFSELAENEPLLGHFDGEPVILVRQGDQIFATGAVCTHYGGPLAEGLVVGRPPSTRCPVSMSCVTAIWSHSAKKSSRTFTFPVN